MGVRWTNLVGLCVVWSLGTSLASGAEETPWPAAVPNFRAIQPGEHPRLLFRKTDLPRLRQRAQTPEGQAILKRLRVQLNGSDGESLPPRYGVKGSVTSDGSGEHAKDPPGTYTLSHVAGYGLLYQLTGDKKYAELGRRCMDLALEGQRDRDRRYSFRAPYGALRAGPSIGWYALGYDLCYDGWDEAYRVKIAQAFASYNEGKWLSLAELARGARQKPGSNHWGMEVGGAALALLAIQNDPGVDRNQIEPLLAESRRAMIRNMTEGFGDGGFFAEGDGTGSMSSHIVFLPALQAWRTAAGQDFITPRPNAQWMALKWFFLSVPRAGAKPHDWFWPQRGAYPHNIWARDGLSGGGYCSIGFGVANPDQQAAIRWFYDHSLKAADDQNGTPFDTPSPYPHHAVLAFVNWPFDRGAKNPGEVLPHAYRDSKWGFYAWRNRWQDVNDTVISILTRPTKGNYRCKAESTLSIVSQGKRRTWGRIRGGFTGAYQPANDGSTVLTCGDGSCLAIDFSRASGADALVALAGPSAPADQTLAVGGTRFDILLLTRGEPPRPEVRGDKIVVGGQTLSWDGRKIILGK